MKDKSLEKNTFWIYSTNKFVWAGVAICSIFSAFMIYFLCVSNLSENKVLFIFLLPICGKSRLFSPTTADPAGAYSCLYNIEERASPQGKDSLKLMVTIPDFFLVLLTPTSPLSVLSSICLPGRIPSFSNFSFQT